MGEFMDFIKGRDTPSPGYKGIDRVMSYDWCRFRREQHCYLPKALNEEATKIEGYAVWVPEDRGVCPRIKWEVQKTCPQGQPGPHADGFTDATVAWEDGGQRGGHPSNLTATDLPWPDRDQPPSR